MAPAQLTVTSSLDPATLTAGTLRYAVHQANADAAQRNFRYYRVQHVPDGQATTITLSRVCWN